MVERKNKLRKGTPLDAGFLEEVRRLGRWPQMFNHRRSEEDNAEHKLADRLRKLKHKLSPTTLQSMEEIDSLPNNKDCWNDDAELPSLDFEIAKDVRR